MRQLRDQAQVHELVINPVIYEKLSLAFASVDAVDTAIERMELMVRELPRPALFLAGRAFARYRKAAGTKANVLENFFVCAHAAVLGCGVLTRHARRYRTYLPTVTLLAPDAGDESAAKQRRR